MPDPKTLSTLDEMRSWNSTSLLFNHLDAWVVASAVVVAALIVHARLAIDTLPLLVAVGSTYWLAFAINDYFDAPHDRQDPVKARGNFFARDSVSPRLFWLAAVGLVLVNCLLLIRYGWMGALIIGVGASVAWAYSAPPIRLKDRPGLDVLTHAMFVESFPYAAILLLLGVAWSALDLFILAVLFLSSVSAQLEQQLRDFDLDRLTGRTFATMTGRRATYVLLVAATVAMVAGAAVYYHHAEVPVYLVPFGVMALPVLGHRIIRGPARARSPRLVTISALAGLAYTAWLVVFHLIPAR